MTPRVSQFVTPFHRLGGTWPRDSRSDAVGMSKVGMCRRIPIFQARHTMTPCAHNADDFIDISVGLYPRIIGLREAYSISSV